MGVHCWPPRNGLAAFTLVTQSAASYLRWQAPCVSRPRKLITADMLHHGSDPGIHTAPSMWHLHHCTALPLLPVARLQQRHIKRQPRAALVPWHSPDRVRNLQVPVQRVARSQHTLVTTTPLDPISKRHRLLLHTKARSHLHQQAHFASSKCAQLGVNSSILTSPTHMHSTWLLHWLAASLKTTVFTGSGALGATFS